MYKNIMEKSLDYIIDFNRITFTCLCFSVYIFVYLHMFFIINFLFIVILPVFFCKMIQSHLLYVRCLEGFSLFSFFLFFFLFCFGMGEGGWADGPI